MRPMLSFKDREDISKIFNNQYYQATHVLGIKYVAQLILKILQNVGFYDIATSQYLSAKELIEELNLAKEAEYPLEWMLRFLGNNNFLYVKKVENIYLFRIKDRDVVPCIQELRSMIVNVDKNILPSCDFMEFVSDHYGEFLRGERSGSEILFAKDKMRLWSKYFSNNNMGYVVYNRLGAIGILKWIQNGLGKYNFLEIGSGTGNASVLLLDELSRNGLFSRIENFILSDVSPMFLRMAKRNVLENFQGKISLETRKIDFNKTLDDQKIFPNEIDIIYGVNSLHAAYDLPSTIGTLAKTLKPGGKLIISECVRREPEDTLVQEIIFNLLNNFCNVKVDGYYRKVPGFLTVDQWVNVFQDVGFVEVDYMLNTDGINNIPTWPVHAMVLKGVKK